MPSSQPTAEPTSPTSQPSPAPTPKPTYQSTPILSFSSAVTVSNVQWVPLTNRTKDAVVYTVAAIVKVPISAVQFVGYEVVGRRPSVVSRGQQLRTEEIFTLLVHTRISILLAAFPAFRSNSTALFNAMTKQLGVAVVVGNFTTQLRANSQALDTNQTLSAEVSAISSLRLEDIVSPTFSPTPKPTPQENLTGAITGAVLGGLVLLAALVAALVYRRRFFEAPPKRNAVYVTDSDASPSHNISRQYVETKSGWETATPARGLQPKQQQKTSAAAAQFHDIRHLSRDYRVFDRISVKPVAANKAPPASLTSLAHPGTAASSSEVQLFHDSDELDDANPRDIEMN